jgi:hypothetical protein
LAVTTVAPMDRAVRAMSTSLHNEASRTLCPASFSLSARPSTDESV